MSVVTQKTEREKELESIVAEIYYRYLDLNRRLFRTKPIDGSALGAIGQLCEGANVPLDDKRLQAVR